MKKKYIYVALLLSLTLIAGTVSGCGKLATSPIGQFVMANKIAVAAGAAVVGALALSNSGGSSATTTTTTTTSTTTTTLPWYGVQGTLLQGNCTFETALVFISSSPSVVFPGNIYASQEVTFSSHEAEFLLITTRGGDCWLLAASPDLANVADSGGYLSAALMERVTLEVNTTILVETFSMEAH